MLSLCLITKNEEKNLPRCLTAAQGVVDEIIVVDTGSSDKTVEIAKSFGAKTYTFSWNDDFSLARNESLKYATQPWILVLDADEAVFKEDLRRLKKFLPKATADGYIMETRNYTNQTNLANWKASSSVEGFTGYVPSHKVRLFKNDPRIRFSNKVHELVEPSIRAYKGTMLLIDDVSVHHYGYAAGDQRNLKLLEETENKDIKKKYELAVAYLNTGDYAKSLDLFLEVAKENRNYAFTLRNIGTLYLKAGRLERAVEYFQESLKIHPNDAATYNNLGVVFMKLKAYDKAAACFARASRIEPKDPRPLRSLALVYKEQGKIEQARVLLEKALKVFPKHPVLEEVMKEL